MLTVNGGYDILKTKNGGMGMNGKGSWLQAWGQSHIHLSLFYYPEKERTFRLIVNSAVSAEAVRVRLSNSYGKNRVKIKRITVAPCDSNGKIISEEQIKICTRNGEEQIVLEKGERIVLDEIPMQFPENSYFCLSACVTEGDLRSGNLLNNARLIFTDGDSTNSLIFEHKPRKRDSVISFAEKIMKIPLHTPIPLFEDIEVYNTDNAKTVAVFGDSLSQQGFWTNAFEKRLRQEFSGKYTLVNKSAMGNRVLRDWSPKFILPGLYGKKAAERIYDEILCYEGISHCIIFLGTNDLIQYGSPDAFSWEKPELGELCGAFANMAQELHRKNIKVIVFTVPAFGAASSGSRKKDALRKEFNSWLTDNASLFDSVIDVSELISDKTDKYYTSAEFLGGDKMHINALGGEKIARAIDLEIFK